MEINERQKLTVKHLADIGITSPEQIIKWASKKVGQTQWRNHKGNRALHVPGRTHSKKYYQEIINFYKK